MPFTSRVLAPTLAAAVLAASLAGCGGGDEPMAASSTPKTSPTGSPTASAESTPTPSEESPDGRDPAVAAFVERLHEGMGEQGSAHVVMTMTGSVRSTAEGDTTYGPGGSEARMTMTMQGLPGEVEMLLVDGVAYMAIEGLTPAGKWFEVPAGSAATESLGNVSPADSLAAFDAGLLRVVAQGEERVDGTTTERFRLHLDAAATLEAMGSEMVPGVPKRLVYTMWLDPDDRMRRIRYQVAGATTVMDLTDWGTPVELEAPAKADLVDAPAGI